MASVTYKIFNGTSWEDIIWSNHLPLSGGTMTGTIKLKSGVAIADANANNLLSYLASTSTVTLGNTSSEINIHGSGTRPTYNGNAMALLSDVTGGYVTQEEHDALQAEVDAIVFGDTIVPKATEASAAGYATKATQDGNGNIISSTYLSVSTASTTYASKSYLQSYVAEKAGAQWDLYHSGKSQTVYLTAQYRYYDYIFVCEDSGGYYEFRVSGEMLFRLAESYGSNDFTIEGSTVKEDGAGASVYLTCMKSNTNFKVTLPSYNYIYRIFRLYDSDFSYEE